MLLSFSSSNAQLSFDAYTNLNDVNCLLEVGDYIWMGGDGGISVRNKSNGAVVATYTTNNGLLNNRITDMAINQAGEIWVVQDYGLSVFDGEEWTGYKESNTTLSAEIWAALQCVAIDFSGVVWLGTHGKGLIRYDGVSWKQYTRQSTGMISDTINDITFSSSGDIWLATADYAYVKPGDNWVKIDGFENPALKKMVFDQNDSLWVCYEMIPGITRFKPNVSQSYVTYLGTVPFRTINVDAEGKIWAGAHNDGVFVLAKGQIEAQYRPPGDDLIAPRIFAIVPDAQGNMWIGTPDGISKYTGTQFINYLNTNTLSGNEIRDIEISTNNTKYFATEFGLSELNSGSWNTVMQGVPNMPHNDVLSLELINDFALWVGTVQGVNFMNVNTGEFPNPVLFQNITFNDILFVEPDVLYFATNNFFGKKVGAGIIDTFGISNGLVNHFVYCLNVDHDANVWAGTAEGIVVYDGNDFIDTLTVTNGQLPYDVVKAIDFDTAGIAWIGTDQGLVKLDGSPYKVYNTLNSGIPSNSIKTLDIDSNNLIWVGTRKGLGVFNGKRWANYNIENGMIANNLLQIHFSEARKERWIGTQSGVVQVKYPLPKAGFVFDTICYAQDNNLTTFTNESKYLDSVAFFQWDMLNDGSIDYTGWNVKHDFQKFGKYPVKLMIQNYSRKDTILKHVLVGSEPDVVISPSQVNLCDGEEVMLESNIMNADTIFDYDYLWSDGQRSAEIKVSAEDTFYLTVTANNCTGTSEGVFVDVLHPYDSAKICMVSVDSSSGKNLIIWEKTPANNIASYNIYKLFGNSYFPIGNVPYDEVTVFEDYSSFPEANAERYAITVIDSCGNESDYSPYHQTIHLGASPGLTANQVVLDWTPYIDESGLFEPAFYYIYRGSHPDSLMLWDSLSTAFTEKNDNNSVGAKYYQVTVRKDAPCDPAGLLKASSGPFSQSLSNMEDNRLQEDAIDASVPSLENELQLEVFPVPFHKHLLVKFRLNQSSQTTIEITNLQGYRMKVLEDCLLLPGEHVYQWQTEQEGIYILKMKIGTSVLVRKIVKQ